MGDQLLSNTTFTVRSINQGTAAAIVKASLETCREIGIEVAVAVVDVAGHLKAFERTDGGSYLATDIAIDKAWTAASFGLSTHGWVSLLENPNAAQLAHRPRIVAAGGGYPIRDQGVLIGGLGISGGNYAQDREACEISLKKLGFDLE